MSWQATQSVLKHSKSKGRERLVLLALAFHAYWENFECYPGRKRLCEETAMSERNLIYALRKLEESGEISVIPGNGRNNLTRYKINLPYEGKEDYASFSPRKDENERVQGTASFSDSLAQETPKPEFERVQGISSFKLETMQPIAPLDNEKDAMDCSLSGKRVQPASPFDTKRMQSTAPIGAEKVQPIAPFGASLAAIESEKRVQDSAERVQDPVKKGARSDSAYKEVEHEKKQKRNRNNHVESDDSTPSDSVASTKNSCAQVIDIFDHWKRTHSHPQAKLTEKRKRKIKARLKEGYTVEQIKSAIHGCRASPFHQGKNRDGTVYDDLELICRDGAKIEFFIEIEKRKRKIEPQSQCPDCMGRGWRKRRDGENAPYLAVECECKAIVIPGGSNERACATGH